MREYLTESSRFNETKKRGKNICAQDGDKIFREEKERYASRRERESFCSSGYNFKRTNVPFHSQSRQLITAFTADTTCQTAIMYINVRFRGI